MISIEILKSSEETAVGVYDFSYDTLYLGRSSKNDLIFTDRELPLHYLLLKIAEEKGSYCLVVKSLCAEPYFFVNGKKVSGTLKIRIGDTIAFGDNKLQIVAFEKNPVNDDLAEAYERFDKTSPELKFALEFIEEVLLDLEKENHV